MIMRILLWLAGALGIFISILKAPFTIISAVRETASKAPREQALRDIKQFLGIYEMGIHPTSSAYKMQIRITKGTNMPELKEAIAKPEFKETILEHIFEYLVFDHDFDDDLVRNNISLVEASADRIISSLNEDIERKLSE
jgi:hypothetical protein